MSRVAFGRAVTSGCPAAATLGQALAKAALSGRGANFVQASGEARFQPYASLYEEALTVGGALRAHGLARFDRVAIVLPDVQAFLRAFLGAVVAGMVPVPICEPAPLGAFAGYWDHVSQIVRASDARAIVTTPELVEQLGTVRPSRADACALLAASDLVGMPLAGPDISVRPDDLVFIQFTSGSTSQPRGVALSHANLWANIHAVGGPAGIDLGPDDVVVSWLPLYHDMGLIGMTLAPMYFGLDQVKLAPQTFLKRPAAWLRAMSKYHGTVSFAPNFAYDYALRRVREADMANLDLSSWRVAGCGAEQVQPDTLADFSKRFATIGFRNTAWLPCYGMAEHTLAITFSPCGRSPRVDTIRSAPLAALRVAIPCAPEEEDTVRFVSCGPSLPGHQLRVVDGSDTSLPDRHVGEIVVRGPSVMRGYCGLEALTRRAVRDGWLHTGDLGYLVDGEIFICGREKDVIVIHGRKYHPQDMEWAAGELTGVRRGTAAAFGTNAFGGREQIVIVVERAPGNADVPDLVERIRARVLDRCGVRPDHVVVVPAGRIPKTSSGKVQRARTRARYEAGEFGDTSRRESGR